VGLFFLYKKGTIAVVVLEYKCTLMEETMRVWMRKYQTELFLLVLGLIILSVQDHGMWSALHK